MHDEVALSHTDGGIEVPPKLVTRASEGAQVHLRHKGLSRLQERTVQEDLDRALNLWKAPRPPNATAEGFGKCVCLEAFLHDVHLQAVRFGSRFLRMIFPTAMKQKQSKSASFLWSRQISKRDNLHQEELHETLWAVMN